MCWSVIAVPAVNVREYKQRYYSDRFNEWTRPSLSLGGIRNLAHSKQPYKCLLLIRESLRPQRQHRLSPHNFKWSVDWFFSHLPTGGIFGVSSYFNIEMWNYKIKTVVGCVTTICSWLLSESNIKKQLGSKHRHLCNHMPLSNISSHASIMIHDSRVHEYICV